jgi:hypothetical protein
MTEPAAPPAVPAADPPAEVDTYVLAVAVGSVIANRGITATVAADEIGIPPEKLSALRRRGDASPAVALRVMAWLHMSPRYFQTADREATIVMVRIPDDAAPADEAPPRAQVA